MDFGGQGLGSLGQRFGLRVGRSRSLKVEKRRQADTIAAPETQTRSTHDLGIGTSIEREDFCTSLQHRLHSSDRIKYRISDSGVELWAREARLLLVHPSVGGGVQSLGIAGLWVKWAFFQRRD